jgi:glycosyltransferase involved in cell wall biosynthesis
MRVCMLAYSFYESDSRIQQYTRALIGRGDEVDVIALRKPGSPEVECLAGVNVSRIQFREVNEQGRLSYLVRILRFLFVSAALLTRKHFEKPYQIIHVHSVPDFLVFAAFVPRMLGARVILDVHDILPEFYMCKFGVRPDSLQFKLLVLIERISAAFSDRVVIANHLWRERLLSRSVRPEKCIAICNYPNPEIFYPRRKAQTNGKFRITYPGTLNWHQGLDVAIRAFAKVAPQMPGAEFHIYGEGPTLPSLRQLAGELDLASRVVFHDYIPIREIADVMGDADVAVVPKRASSPFGNEAASTKIMEFMALGVPVIVSRTKVDTYYHDDTRVKFFESENESDLASSLMEVWRDRRKRNHLAENASRYVAENSWEIKKQDYLQMVDSLHCAKP